MSLRDLERLPCVPLNSNLYIYTWIMKSLISQNMKNYVLFYFICQIFWRTNMSTNLMVLTKKNKNKIYCWILYFRYWIGILLTDRRNFLYFSFLTNSIRWDTKRTFDILLHNCINLVILQSPKSLLNSYSLDFICLFWNIIMTAS